MEQKKRLVIIDSNALLHRSFHALPPLTKKNGEQTGAIYGFLLTLFRIIKDLKPDFVVACFDLPALTFRHKEFKDYKAHRPKTPEPLSQQIPKMEEVLKNLGIPVFEKEGYEADDLIATIAKMAKTEKAAPQLEIYILTGDLDSLQLVDDSIKVCTLGKGIKEMVIYDSEKVMSRFGIKPEQMIYFKALSGDSSDNIPGVPGVGEKTALDLLKKFYNLESLYREIKKGGADIKERVKDILLEKKEQAFFSLSLVTAKNDVPIDFKMESCRFGNFDYKKVEQILKDFEFFSLIKRLPELNPSLQQKLI